MPAAGDLPPALHTGTLFPAENPAEFFVRNAKKGKHLKSGEPLKITDGKFIEKFAPYEVKIMIIGQ